MCLRAESAAVFANGDNTYNAVGVAGHADTSRSAPVKVEIGLADVGGCVKIIAASGFASFALVGSLVRFVVLVSSGQSCESELPCSVLPIPDSLQRPASRQDPSRLTSIERMAQGRMHSLQKVSTRDFTMNAVSSNNRTVHITWACRFVMSLNTSLTYYLLY